AVEIPEAGGRAGAPDPGGPEGVSVDPSPPQVPGEQKARQDQGAIDEVATREHDLPNGWSYSATASPRRESDTARPAAGPGRSRAARSPGGRGGRPPAERAPSRYSPPAGSASGHRSAGHIARGERHSGSSATTDPEWPPG